MWYVWWIFRKTIIVLTNVLQAGNKDVFVIFDAQKKLELAHHGEWHGINRGYDGGFWGQKSILRNGWYHWMDDHALTWLQEAGRHWTGYSTQLSS